MYLLTKDYAGDDGDRWLVGSYDERGNWIDAPTVAGHATPSYDFHTASQHLMNMNAELEKRQSQEVTIQESQSHQGRDEGVQSFLKTAILTAMLVFLLLISIRVLAVMLFVMLPLLLVFFGIIIAMIVIKGLF